MQIDNDSESTEDEMDRTDTKPEYVDNELELFKLEYEQLAEGYRHTYQTVWQAGSVFMVISTVLLALGATDYAEAHGFELLIRWIWPLPFFFWWLGIFTPMDRYGKIRLQRLQELEKYTWDNCKWSYQMRHFTYNVQLRKRQKLFVFSKLRVGYVIDVFAIVFASVWIIFLLY